MILFYSNSDIFSNFYKCEIKVFANTFSSSEQLFMYLKALIFADIDTALAILSAQGPSEAKKLGRSAIPFDQESWDIVKQQLMYIANYAKFDKNEELKKALLATDNKLLVEASPYDKIWGIGLSKDDPKALNPANWKGLNLLGEVLMDVRKVLRKNEGV